jgi:sec-independent protein translocase protein TatC
MNDREQTLFEHLAELRARIIRSVLAIVVCVIIAVVFSQQVFNYIMAQAKTEGVQLVQFSFADAFLTQFKLAVLGGMVLAFPFVLYQAVAFILPALHPSERRILWIGLPFATLMFVLGWAFGWFVVVPITKSFFMDVAGTAGVINQITPSNYVSFVLGICNPLGIAFELPLLVLILARIGLVSAGFLARVRKFAFLAIMVLAAVLSPPDVISMAIFLVPLYGLYEFSILLARLAAPKDR